MKTLKNILFHPLNTTLNVFDMVMFSFNDWP